MFNFIRYSNSQTLDSEITQNSAYLQFSPSLFIGHENAGIKTPDALSDYDKFDEKTLKHFKLTVGSISNEPILRMDSHDLYVGGDHTRQAPTSLTSLHFDKEAGDGGAGAPMLGNPVKFQRVHFRAQKGQEGAVQEYYAIFLVSDPVKISSTSIGPNYLDENCENLPASEIAQTDFEEQDGISEVSSWNDLSYITESNIETPTSEQFAERLIMGDSIRSQSYFTKLIGSENYCIGLPLCEDEDDVFNDLNIFASSTSDNGKEVISKISMKNLNYLILKNLVKTIGPFIVTQIGEGGNFVIKKLECSDGASYEFTASETDGEITCESLGCESEGGTGSPSPNPISGDDDPCSDPSYDDYNGICNTFLNSSLSESSISVTKQKIDKNNLPNVIKDIIKK